VKALEAENKDLKAKLANAKSASHLAAPARDQSLPDQSSGRIFSGPGKSFSDRDKALLSKVFQQMLNPGSPIAENAARALLDICERSAIHPTELEVLPSKSMSYLQRVNDELERLRTELRSAKDALASEVRKNETLQATIKKLRTESRKAA
jgi:dynactin complex subunit